MCWIISLRVRCSCPVCVCVTIGVHVNKHCVSIYRQGLLRKAFDEEQQSDPPAFMLGCRREQHTEGLE